MENLLEKPVKKAVLEENKVVYYRVKVNYTDTRPQVITPSDKLIPKSIEGEAYELEAEGIASEAEKKDTDKWTKRVKTIVNDSFEVNQTDIKGKKSASGGIDRMDILSGKIDTFLAETPKGTWRDFSRPMTKEFQKLTGVNNYSGHPLFESLKNEFSIKQEQLNTKINQSTPASLSDLINNTLIIMNKLDGGITQSSVDLWVIVDGNKRSIDKKAEEALSKEKYFKITKVLIHHAVFA